MGSDRLPRLAGAICLAFAVASLLGIPTARAAEPTAAEKDTARGLMAEGRASLENGDLKGALKSFSAADAIMHVPTTGFAVARTQAALGLLVAARETATRVAKSLEKESDPTPFKQARVGAAALREELDARIPVVTIAVKNVPDGATLLVALDNAPLGPDALREPHPVDPGHHVIVAKAGTVDAKEEIDVAERDRTEVAMVLPSAPPVPARAPSAAPRPEKDAAPLETVPELVPGRPALSNTLLLGGFGLAAAGVVAGTVAGVLSLTKTSAVKSSGGCSGNVCGPTEYSDISSARSMATISNISFVAAGVGAVAGVVGLLGVGSTTTPHPAAQSSRVRREGAFRMEPWGGVLASPGGHAADRAAYAGGVRGVF
jgi:hypothetical protein